MAKGWTWFVYIGGPLLIALFGWVLVLPFYEKEVPAKAVWFLVPLALVMIIVMVLGMIDAHKGRLIIQADRITSVGVLSTRELVFEEIKGYRVTEQYIFIESLVKGRKRIKISKYIGGFQEIQHWLSQRFKDLDVVLAQEEEQVILDDEQLGWSREERETKLAKARKVCKVMNLVSVVVSLWAMFYPHPYGLSIGVVMAMPVLALVVMRLHAGFIGIDEKKSSAYPSLAYTFILPAAALVLRALLDYDIFDHSPAWRPIGVLAVIFLFLLFFKQGKHFFRRRSDYWSAVSVSLFLLGYCYGTVMHVNCYYDDAKPEHYTAEVLTQRKSSGKTTSYYLDLSPWGPQATEEEASVDRSLFNRVAEGDTVNIYFRPGKLGIAWFEVSDR